MALRKLAAVAPAIAVLTLAAPMAGASDQAAPAPGAPGSMIQCYPEPAFCGPNGAPWFPALNLPATQAPSGLAPGFLLP